MKNVIQRISFVLTSTLLSLSLVACEAKREASATQVTLNMNKSVAPLEAIKEVTEGVGFQLSESIDNMKIGETEIQVATYKASDQFPLYFRPHENETTSSVATKETLKNYGGTFVELRSRGERLIRFTLKNRTYTFDPNRIFSVVGIMKTLKRNGNTSSEAQKEVSRFVNVLVSRVLTSESLIIAVHNNTNGGPLSVNSYRGSLEVSSININPNRDADEFFYVTHERHFEFLKGKGFNVVLQNTARVSDDGSLSVYCGKRKIAYINVESEHGHLKEQIEMMGVIQEIVKGK